MEGQQEPPGTFLQMGDKETRFRWSKNSDLSVTTDYRALCFQHFQYHFKGFKALNQNFLSTGTQKYFG